MPLSISFIKDPESHCSIHRHSLMGRKYQPSSKMWGKAKELDLDYYHLMHHDTPNRKRTELVPEKFLIEWMDDFMRDVEKTLNNEAFHFEFAYHMTVMRGDVEGSKTTCPIWFVTIRDFEGNIVHKNWTIAFDNRADLLIKRGPATNEDPMSNAPNFRHYEEMMMKLFSAIREHVRLRNFRLERMKHT